MFCHKNESCLNCPEREDCQNIGNVEIENKSAEKALASIYKTFCVFCLILIFVSLI